MVLAGKAIAVAAWTRERPARSRINGRYARLEPLDPDRHGTDLWRAFAGHTELWTYMATGPFADEAQFQAWLRAASSLSDPLYYAVVDGGEKPPGSPHPALGWLTLMEIRPSAGVIEVGNIVFSPALQKTCVATDAIHLAARTAFETLGYRRLEWKCNDLNEASKRAALRFGFTYEGLFRQHNVIKGFNRDTAWFAMLDHEWPARKAAFDAWLAPDNFDSAGRQRRPLSAAGHKTL